MERVEGRVATLLVPRDELTSVLDRLLGDFEVVDVTVTDPPIEKIMGRVFRSGMEGEVEAGAGDELTASGLSV